MSNILEEVEDYMISMNVEDIDTREHEGIQIISGSSPLEDGYSVLVQVLVDEDNITCMARPVYALSNEMQAEGMSFSVTQDADVNSPLNALPYVFTQAETQCNLFKQFGEMPNNEEAIRECMAAQQMEHLPDAVRSALTKYVYMVSASSSDGKSLMINLSDEYTEA